MAHGAGRRKARRRRRAGAGSRATAAGRDAVELAEQQQLQGAGAAASFSIGAIVSRGLASRWRRGSSGGGGGGGSGLIPGDALGGITDRVDGADRGGGRALSRRERVVQAVREQDALELARLCVEPGGLGRLSAGGSAARSGAQCCSPRRVAAAVARVSHGEEEDDDALRAQAWTVLLTADAFERLGPSSAARAGRSGAEVRGECEMDIVRSLNGFQCCRALPGKERDAARERLAEVVTGVLRAQPALYYYQGFHDVCTVFLHVFRSRPPGEALAAAELMASQVFADHHRSDFGTTIKFMDLVLVVLKAFDAQVHAVLASVGVGPMFALSWVITGFAHSVPDAAAVARVYDALLAAHPLLPAYLCAAMVSRPHTRKQLFRVVRAAGRGAPEECMPELHHALQTVAVPTLPPQAHSARVASRARSRRHRRQSKKSAAVADAGRVLQEARLPASREEEAENSVDLLVETAMAMMCVYPPNQVCRDYDQASAAAAASSKGSGRDDQPAVALPVHSVAKVPMEQKRHWAAALDSVRDSSPLVAVLASQGAGRFGALDRQRRQRLYYLGLATVIGVTAVASSWMGMTFVE